MATYDKKDMLEPTVKCLNFQSLSKINLSTSPTLWLAIFKSSKEPATPSIGMCKRNLFSLKLLLVLSQQSYSKDKGEITSF